MAKIARINGRPVPDDLLEQLKSVNLKTRRKYSIAVSERIRSESIKSASDVPKSPEVELKVEDPNGSVMDILRRRGLRKKFLILTLAWTASVTTYRGLTLNFENFHGNEFVNWFLLSVVEFPSNWASWYLMGNTR